jgi:hypothetical protein
MLNARDLPIQNYECISDPITCDGNAAPERSGH